MLILVFFAFFQQGKLAGLPLPTLKHYQTAFEEICCPKAKVFDVDGYLKVSCVQNKTEFQTVVNEIFKRHYDYLTQDQFKKKHHPKANKLYSFHKPNIMKGFRQAYKTSAP